MTSEAGPSTKATYNLSLSIGNDISEAVEDINKNFDQFDLLSAHFGRRRFPPVSPIVTDSEVCKEWEAGRCSKGEKCRFKHVEKNRPIKKISSSKNGWLVNMAIKVQKVEDEEVVNNEEIKEKVGARKVDEEGTKYVEEKREDFDKMFMELGRKRREEQSGKSVEEWQKESEVKYEAGVELGEKNDGEWEMVAKEEGTRGNLERKSPSQPLKVNHEEEANVIEHYIVLQSSLLTCGAGFAILQVIPGYDLRRISIKNLPIGTKREEVADILAERGASRLDFSVLNLQEVGNSLQATIVCDAKIAHNVAGGLDGLDGLVFRNKVLTFENRVDAVWTAGSMERNEPSLTLTWAESTPPLALANVYERLTASKGVRMDTCYLLPPGTVSIANQVTMIVTFDSWDNLLLAAQEIEANHRKEIPSLRLSHPTPHIYSISIPYAQYEAQKKQWLALAEVKNQREARITVEREGQEQARIQVQGENRAVMGALKVRVEKLAGGEVLGGPYWHPSFASTEDSGAFFRQVMKSSAVHLKADLGARAVRLYGDIERVEQAQRMIQEEVRSREQVKTRTVLDDAAGDFFVREGFAKLEELVGEDNVDLKITSKWSAIMMRGGEEATHHLRRLLRESTAEDFQDDFLDPVGTCPVCYNDVENPERLGCGHGYCSVCLKNLFTAATESKTFPILCMGDEGMCDVPIALPQIRRFLPHHSFERLSEAAFAGYLERNPQQFRYCKTADCKQTYRRQTSVTTTLQCPSCFLSSCSACEENHNGMSCQEYRIHKDPAEQERLNGQLAAANGYKRCPRCAVWIEKTAGCNHMSCKCGAHICWICLGVFTPGQIYEHIRITHGQ